MTAVPNNTRTKTLRGLPIEERLLAYIEQLERHRKGRRAVRLHLSLLAAHNRREQHIQAAINAFDGLIRMFDGEIFAIGNSDLILVFAGANVLKIDQAVQKVRFLFSEDALFEIDPAEGARKFCTWYDIESELDAFRRDVQNCLKQHQIRQATERKRPPAAANHRQTEALLNIAGSGSMSFAEYGNVEALLATADLTSLIRQQPICALTRDDPPQRVFDELFVSIADLQKTLAPDKSLTDDRWLFQRLTRTLDRRVLKVLNGSAGLSPTKSMSLNMNVATLLTPDFQAFDSGLRTGARGTIMLELNVLDIFGDIGAYVYARDLVRERGYRVCIDGLTHLTATFIDRDKLGADMVKIYWSPDIAEDPAGNQAIALAQSVRSAGAARVVLCRCNDGRAVRAGLELGIAMFQGRQIDRMLQDGTTIANAV
jgi:hypothetical protein